MAVYNYLDQIFELYLYHCEQGGCGSLQGDAGKEGGYRIILILNLLGGTLMWNVYRIHHLLNEKDFIKKQPVYHPLFQLRWKKELAPTDMLFAPASHLVIIAIGHSSIRASLGN